VFPDVPVTSKPTEVRMGKGKGAVDYWGRASSRAASCSRSMASTKRRRESLRLGAAKLSVRTRFVQRIAE
jgi:large subunit ribosomal protein L16